MIGFEPSVEQITLQEHFRRLSETTVRPLSLKVDVGHPGPIDENYLDLIAKENLNAFIIPSQYGGRLLDHVSLALVIEELSYGCAGLATIYITTLHVVFALLIGGSETQKESFLPSLLQSSSVVAGGITEDRGGSDTTSFSTIARLEGDHYVINGIKSIVFNAGNASFYLVWANSVATKGREGINVFIVPKETPGISFGEYHDKPGLRCVPSATMTFQDVVVSKSNLIGLPGSGYLLLMQMLDIGRAFFGAICVGLARAALEEIINFAKGRIIRNHPIIKNQGISFSLAELATEIESARFLVWKACRLMDLRQDFTRESSMAKLYASEVAAKTTNEGMVILGRKSYVQQSSMAKYQRDAQALRILVGPSQIQKIIISSQL
ncbi:MAG TPA: acyl-CoA dehydrogenase family protein [Syntrophales bacterium]|nr:acyl-CoA dehydrogenase family protein [Syntrophales bacterium]